MEKILSQLSYTKTLTKANYILNNPTIIKPSTNNSNDTRLFVAAKEVNTIDSYAADQNINKLDLVIDWGWFYFFTNPCSLLLITYSNILETSE